MLTLSEMQNTPASDLVALALVPGNKYYSCALTHMAHAQTEFVLSGRRTSAVDVHVSAAVKAYELAQNEALTLAAVKATEAVVSSRGAKLDAVKGKDVGKLPMSRMGAIWQDSWFAR